jgi:2-polyprenyl-6-methoxyphenol hydroxylase-like FAD-dependent oxidoreductase
VHADLIIGADGRHSTVRERAGLKVEDLGAPMDVLWMRLSKRPEDGSQTLGRILPGRMFVMIDRGDIGNAPIWSQKAASRRYVAKVLPASANH